MNANLSILCGEKGKPHYWASRMFSWASPFSQCKYDTSVITAHDTTADFFPQLWCFFYPKLCRAATFCHWAAITFGLEGNLLAQLCQLELSIWMGSTHSFVSSDGFFYSLMPPTNLPLPPPPNPLDLVLYSTSSLYSGPIEAPSRCRFFFLLIKFLFILLHQL